ncbi:MAG: BamA/TamA family outer membrane protein, partial [Bacteroidota bacterium]
RFSSTFQSHVLLYSSNWFTKGLVDYIGEGWDYQDETWLQSIPSEQMLQLAIEGEGKPHKVLRKSLWHFIVHEYSEQKIAEIVYLANISHSIESGIISVLGITLKTLTERWREHVLERSASNANGRTELGHLEKLEEVPIKNQQELMTFAYDPTGKQLAVYLDQGNQHVLSRYDLSTQEWSSLSTSTPGASGTYMYPLAWSKDGNFLATTSFRNGILHLVYHDIRENNSTLVPIEGVLSQVNNLSWSHDGTQLALSGMRSGKTDIFTLKALEPAAVPKALTNDPYDDIEPSWSYDDASIFFSSNRDTIGLTTTVKHWESYKSDYDLFIYPLSEEAKELKQLTKTPTIDEHLPFAPNSFELVYQSDQLGIQNLSKINIFLGETQPLTNLARGIDGLDLHENSLAFSSPFEGKLSLFHLPMSSLTPPERTEPTLLRMEYLIAFNEAERKKQELEILIQQQEAARLELEAKQRLFDSLKQISAEEPPEAPKAPEPTTEEEKPKVRYYIFDEEEDPYEVKAEEEEIFQEIERETASVLKGTFKPEQAPSLSTIKVDKPVAASSRWSADFMDLGVNFDPIARYGVPFGLRYTDQFHHHQLDFNITPYLNLRNGDAQVKYAYLKKKLDLYVQAGYTRRHLQRSSLFFPIDSLIFRYDQVLVDMGVRYPIARNAFVDVEIGGRRIQRRDLKLINPELQDQTDHLARAGVATGFDNTQAREGLPFKGMRGELAANSLYSTSSSDFAFHSVQLDLQRYDQVYNHITLATRLAAGASFGPSQQRFYLGGDMATLGGIALADNSEGDQLRDQVTRVNPDVTTFSFQEFITPARGFWFNSRSGSKYVLLNAELWIPISRMAKRALNSGPLYSLEFIPFMDVGTAWDSGNPFSQKNPTDVQIVTNGTVTVELQTLKSPFLFTFGSGLRTRILGYLLRMDMAFGMEDNTLQSPMLLLSLGKNF